MFDFERAKQKFDNQLLSRSKTSSSSHKTKSGSSCSSQKRSAVYVPENLLNDAPVSKQNFNETVQFFDENIRNTKRDSSTNKNTGINLDGLKVSEDDEDVSNFK